MADTYIGIDPGNSGGISTISLNLCSATKFAGMTERDVWDIISELASGNVHLFIEHVHSMPGQGVASMFNFGKHYGMLRGMVIASQIPFESVQPLKWQTEFGLKKKKGETNTQKKNRHKAKAQELFPTLKITHATADAILIAEYGRRVMS